MKYSVQIAIDSEQPHDLADWWSQTLGWTVEPSDEAFIRSMIEQGYATDEQTMSHNGVLVWTAGAAINPPAELAGAPRILFQLVPEAKSVKNRVHWMCARPMRRPMQTTRRLSHVVRASCTRRAKARIAG